MYFHCFGAKLSDSFQLCSYLSLFCPFLSSLTATLAVLHACSLPEASGKRTANCLDACTLTLLRLNPDQPMAWLPFFV